MSTIHRRQSPPGLPTELFPPEGYRIVEPGLYCATSCPVPANFPFIARLKLRTVINVSSSPLSRLVTDFFDGYGVTILSASGQDAFDGCMVGQSLDIGEEVVKEALEMILDASNHPTMVVCPGVDHESGRVIGCMRRLQHWSMTAIFDEYRTSTNSRTTYDINERFIERFEVELVSLPQRLPLWLDTHLAMLAEEIAAEEKLEEEEAAALAAAASAAASKAMTYEEEEAATTAAATTAAAAAAATAAEATAAASEATAAGEAAAAEAAAAAAAATRKSSVALYRLNRFLARGGLVSPEAVFNEKLWLLEEEDE